MILDNPVSMNLPTSFDTSGLISHPNTIRPALLPYNRRRTLSCVDTPSLCFDLLYIAYLFFIIFCTSSFITSAYSVYPNNLHYSYNRSDIIYGSVMIWRLTIYLIISHTTATATMTIITISSFVVGFGNLKSVMNNIIARIMIP